MQHREVSTGQRTVHVLVLDAGDRFPRVLEDFAEERGLRGASFQAIGAFRGATFGYFEPRAQEYRRNEVDEQVEVVSLSGNVTRAGGRAKVHAHGVVARSDGTTLGGHVLDAIVRPTLELVLEETPAPLCRTFRPEVGLALIDLEAGREACGESSTLVGRRRWAIPEGYIPAESHGPEPEMKSHETACILNTGARDAHVEITVYFADREPVGPYLVEVAARRTKHVRFDRLRDPAPIPRATDYASLIVADVPIVVQHTRLDSRQSENALLSTVAFAAD